MLVGVEKEVDEVREVMAQRGGRSCTALQPCKTYNFTLSHMATNWRVCFDLLFSSIGSFLELSLECPSLDKRVFAVNLSHMSANVYVCVCARAHAFKL